MRSFTYRFETSDGERYEYTHSSDADGHIAADTSYPEWTKLEYKQCEGCKWYKTEHCPVAVGLIEPSKLLGKLVSFDAVSVTVIGPERSYHKECTAQEGLSALFGLIMATSGCPNFEFLRGLAWYHLPFAAYEETLFRAISAYLVRGYLEGTLEPNANITAQIQALYDAVHHSNVGISQRLRYGVAPETDSPMNAIVILDSIGTMVPMSADAGLKDLREIFL